MAYGFGPNWGTAYTDQIYVSVPEASGLVGQGVENTLFDPRWGATFSIWAYPDSTGQSGTGRFWAHRDGPSRLEFATGGTIRFYIDTPVQDGYWYLASGGIPLDQWNRVVVRVNPGGTTISWWVNGTLTSPTLGQTPNYSSGSDQYWGTYIGNLYQLTGFDGMLAEMGWWARALSDGECARVSLYGPSVCLEKLLFYMPLSEAVPLIYSNIRGDFKVVGRPRVDLNHGFLRHPHPPWNTKSRILVPQRLLFEKPEIITMTDAPVDLGIIPNTADWDTVDQKTVIPAGANDGPGGDWDSLTHPPWACFKYNNLFWLYYGGADYYAGAPDETPAFRAIGVATSEDGYSFTEYASNPVITFNPSGAGHVEEGAVGLGLYVDGSTFRAYFSGNTDVGDYDVDMGIYYTASSDGFTFSPLSPPTTIYAPSTHELWVQWAYKYGTKYYIGYTYRQGAPNGVNNSMYVMESTSPSSGFGTPGTPVLAGEYLPWHTRVIDFDSTYNLLWCTGNGGLSVDKKVQVFYFRKDNPYRLFGPLTDKDYNSDYAGKIAFYNVDSGFWRSFEAKGWYDGIVLRTALVPKLEGFRFREDDGTWLDTQDTDVSLGVGEQARLRMIVEKPVAGAYEFQAEHDGAGDWFKVIE